MIKVMDGTGVKTEMRDVPIGECFIYDGDLYLKMRGAHEHIFEDTVDYPCVCLENGTVYDFQMYEPVEVIHFCELVIKRGL